MRDSAQVLKAQTQVQAQSLKDQAAERPVVAYVQSQLDRISKGSQGIAAVSQSFSSEMRKTVGALVDVYCTQLAAAKDVLSSTKDAATSQVRTWPAARIPHSWPLTPPDLPYPPEP